MCLPGNRPASVVGGADPARPIERPAGSAGGSRRTSILTRTTTATVPEDAQARREHLVALLERCAQGHESALEELYRLGSAQLYGVLLRILKIESIAEDALQESFVKIWENAGGYTAELGAPMTWMSTVARHQALDMLRKRGRRERHEGPDLAGLIDATPAGAGSSAEPSEEAELLLRCLERLPEAARDCVIRSYCEGYSHEELSAAHGRPLGTVKSWIRRGLLSLRRCLDELA